ncbi:dermonecrotic toxin domain-containing protein [Pseudomonas sp. LB3P31]
MSSHTSQPQNDSTPLVETNDLVNQTSHGPVLHEVASQLLRQALDKAYPQLRIDPERATLGTPQWLIVEDHVEAGATQFDLLTTVLVRQSLFGTKANFLEGEHFLTLEPDVSNPVHLAVSIEEIAKILNNLAVMLFVELQVRQLDFWNAKGHKIARWQELSDTLRKMMNVQKVKSWDADECAMAREVFRDPDRTSRKNVNSEFSAIQACLIDIDIAGESIDNHLLIGGALVLKATYRKRPLLVMYTIERAYESFSSMEELGNSLPERLEDLPEEHALTWRLHEPEGNIFDHMAWALVSSQLDAINALQFLDKTGDKSQPEPGLDLEEKARFLQINTAIPDWLRNAPAGDIHDYSRYISALGLLYRRPASKLARAEIPPISDYAQGQMRDAIIADPSAVDAEDLPLDDLRIKITNSFTTGNFTLPNPLDQHLETLADFALENVAPYQAAISFVGGETVPQWLTPDLLTTLSARVDIGKTYPDLIKPRLLGDPVTSRRQEDFYREQLRLLLPMQALEARFKPETGVDERGYQYVCELLDKNLDAKTIALYPLTLTPQHRLTSTSDTVANMFIISPRVAHNAPCLLYRPMFDEPLLQYPSRQNLLYALHQPGDLRDSVLAWLPDKTLSFEYAQYVFPTGLPSPWLVVEELVNPFQHSASFGRAVMESVEVSGDPLLALFKSNAQALVDFADRQSQSNAEQRWSVLKDSAWALFDIASNFLSGAVGTAVWVWQTINQIQQALDARERGDSFIEWTSVSDILLAVGIILSHHAVMRRQKVSTEPRVEKLPTQKAPTARVEPVSIKLNPDALPADLPLSHISALDLAGSVPRRTSTALGAYLDTLKVAAPDLSSASVTRLKDAPPHIYRDATRNYAQVGERWFHVRLQGDDDDVYILDPNQPERTGPKLAISGQGQWVLDLRLRLRGGSGNAMSRHQEAADQQRLSTLDDALKSFKLLQNSKEAELTRLHDAIQLASTEDYDAQTALYVEKLDTTIDEYRQVLQQLSEWRSLGGTENYQEDLLRMSIALQRNLSLWFVIKRAEYGQAISVMTRAGQKEAVPRQTYVDNVQKASTLGQEMVEKLALSTSTLEGMRAAGKSGTESAMKIRKLTPSFTELDLKANEIGMAQELCLNELANPLMQQARIAVGKIVVSAAKAAIMIADLMKTRGAPPDPQVRIEALSTLVEVFADANQRIRELPGAYPGIVKQPKLNQLRNLIDEFSLLAQKRLDALLPESADITERLTVDRAQPGPSRQPVKVRKTRPREPGKVEPEKTPEEPLKPFTPAIYQQPARSLSDQETIETGIELNLDTGKFIERTRKDALLPRRIPADIQDVFDQQATKLEQAAKGVDQAVINIKEADDTDLPVGSLSSELSAGAIHLRNEGVRVRADLYTRRKPTQSIFQWMHDNDQVDISRDRRGRIQTKGLGDFFQEYRIADKTRNKPLWVAHFHYDTLHSLANAPTAAHLKISEDYLKTLAPDLQKVLNTFEPIDGVFRKISDPALRKLFLDLEPVAQIGS